MSKRAEELIDRIRAHKIVTNGAFSQAVFTNHNCIALIDAELRKERKRAAQVACDYVDSMMGATPVSPTNYKIGLRAAVLATPAEGTTQEGEAEPLSYMSRAELQLNIMRNIEREIKNLDRDGEGDEGVSLRYWWQHTANWAKVQRIINGNTSKAGSTSSTQQCAFMGADVDGYSFAALTHEATGGKA
jgi:hypothetical protein